MPETILTGPQGRIEGRYQSSRKARAPIALMLHPHPQRGGTMNNRVVHGLYHTFYKRGFSVMRFNFRGVGQSQGQFSDGDGELGDAAAVLDWLQANNPEAATCWVAGFSFGAWIGMQLLMRRPEIEGFISVSPPVNKFDFSFLAPCPTSGLLLHGDQDRQTAPEAVAKLAKKLSAPKNVTVSYKLVAQANHAFSGTALNRMLDIVDTYLASGLKESCYRPPSPDLEDINVNQETDYIDPF